ncbi:type IV toxin-antitoxin system AbiEi family antitoxin domain-containing protein [Nocardioides sp. WS12]|uniref:type IV toxin-antitoxin system AbiEi family antitoxin domain-containing protein n=1 Tax=Nocardioides sp. WS12 TaxID=2486272 RepID=UPI00191E9F77|nr:type IV toxin-antitoxin system AbiEi family antitoxin domain-containing protein [Nocardioides sp. WS12]
MPRHLEFTHPGLQELLVREQHGVVSRQQLLALGATDHDIARMVRRRELTAPCPGVYVDHTGRLTRAQREWVALFTCAPAALSHESAMPGGDPPVVHVCVGPDRTVRRMAGVVVHRTAHLATRVDWRRRPPRMAPEHATVDVMESRIRSGDVAGAYAALTRACYTREVGPPILRSALAHRARVTRRALIAGMIDDVEHGANSVLERGYLQLVERAHGLPRARRQQASHATGRKTVQDVRYEEFGVIVEPDGRAFHDSPEARDVDARRDLAERAVSEAVTLRVTYGLVFNDGCRTARWIATILQRRGWNGVLQRCPRCP